MPVGAITAFVEIVIITIAVLIVIAVPTARRRRLRKRFGPEYDQAVAETGSRSKADAELSMRLRRAQELDIRPLSAAARAVYLDQWPVIQETFVDQPDAAVGQARQLIGRVMADRGYTTEDDGRMLADLSVGHAQSMHHYRSAQALSARPADGAPSTEDLRQAMIHYRVMFGDLLADPGDQRDAVAPGQHPGISAGDESAQLRNG
jgi:hypothetical protein